MDLLALHKKAKEASINIDIRISGADWDQRMTVTGRTITDNFYDSEYYARTISIQEIEGFNGRDIDILDFVENVLGLELLDSQRALLMEFYKLHKDGVKVVYGRRGKIYVIPVED